MNEFLTKRGFDSQKKQKYGRGEGRNPPLVKVYPDYLAGISHGCILGINKLLVFSIKSHFCSNEK